MDTLKVKLTLRAAESALDRLEQAISEYNDRQVGAELYRLRRELSNLKKLIEPETKRRAKVEKS